MLPSTLVVHPILQPYTAYWMLRPFFKPTRQGSLDGWKFSLDDDDDDGHVFLHGANSGTAQEHNPEHHPHLLLNETMIPYPTVDLGDTGKGYFRQSLTPADLSNVLERRYHPWYGEREHGGCRCVCFLHTIRSSNS